VRRDQGCPMLGTASSRQLQWTHCRAQLSPSAKRRPCENVFKQGQNTALSEGVGGNCRPTLQTPRLAKEEGEEVLQKLEQRFPCSLWRRPQ